MNAKGKYKRNRGIHFKTCSLCWRPAFKGRYCRHCHAAYMRSWRKTNPLTPEQRLKANCRRYTAVLVQRGKLKKEPCAFCGSTNVEAHHEDYTKPWKVNWLCRDHHLALHSHDQLPYSSTRLYGEIEKLPFTVLELEK